MEAAIWTVSRSGPSGHSEICANYQAPPSLSKSVRLAALIGVDHGLLFVAAVATSLERHRQGLPRLFVDARSAQSCDDGGLGRETEKLFEPIELVGIGSHIKNRVNDVLSRLDCPLRRIGSLNRVHP